MTVYHILLPNQRTRLKGPRSANARLLEARELAGTLQLPAEAPATQLSTYKYEPSSLAEDIPSSPRSEVYPTTLQRNSKVNSVRRQHAFSASAA